MSDVVNALQKAIYERLAGDAALTAIIGSGGIFDRRVTGKPMPYLVIAEVTSREIGPELEEHEIVLEAWSDAEGRKEVQTIARMVRDLVQDADLDLADANLVNLQHISTTMKREPKTKAFKAETRFRAVTG